MKRFILCTTVLAISGSALAQDVFEKLAGSWNGGGEVRGMDSSQTMTWQPELAGRFTRLVFNNVMKHESGSEFRFQAHAYYKVTADGSIQGHWFDSRGVDFPLQGTQDDFTLSIEWGSPEIELGRTTYRLLEDHLEVTDEVLSTEGEWRTFGQSKLSRAEMETP